MSQTCGNCGTAAENNDVFCGNCGQSLQSADSAGSGPVAVVDMPTGMWTPDTAVASVGAPDPGAPGIGTSGPMRWPTADAAQSDAAVGEATPNTTYVGMRLQYEKNPEPPFDPIGNSRFLFQMARQALVYWWAFLAGAVLFGIIFGVLFFALGGFSFILYAIGAAVAWLVLACCFWLLPHPVLLSEWKFSVDGKGAASAVTFEHIAWALQQRGTPLDSVRVQRLNLPGEGKRDYLELRRGLFIGYVGCFPYGQDLYVGWTFWVSLSPLRWLFMVLARVWQTATRHGTDLHVTLRYDSARAMREAMHAAAREGVDVAIGRTSARGQGTIGSSIAVAETAVLAR
jgi:hypothetical protein